LKNNQLCEDCKETSKKTVSSYYLLALKQLNTQEVVNLILACQQ